MHVSAHREWVLHQYYSYHWSSSVHSCSQGVRFCIKRVLFLSLIVPCAFLLTARAFLHRWSIIPVTDCPPHISAHRKWVPASTSLTSLIIPCAFLLTERVFLHWQSIIPITDCPLHVSAHRKWVPTSISFTSLILPWALLLTACEFLQWLNLIPATNCPLCAPAHS